MISEEIAKKYGQDYILRQLAEECGELTQAALKLIRAWKKETPTPSSKCRDSLVEEMADVQLMLDWVRREVLTADERVRIYHTMETKDVRSYERMILKEVVGDDD